LKRNDPEAAKLAALAAQAPPLTREQADRIHALLCVDPAGDRTARPVSGAT